MKRELSGCRAAFRADLGTPRLGVSAATLKEHGGVETALRSYGPIHKVMVRIAQIAMSTQKRLHKSLGHKVLRISPALTSKASLLAHSLTLEMTWFVRQ